MVKSDLLSFDVEKIGIAQNTKMARLKVYFERFGGSMVADVVKSRHRRSFVFVEFSLRLVVVVELK